MIRLGNRPVRGFGLGAISAPASSGATVLAALAGAGAGVGTAVFAHKLGAQPWEAVAGGVGTAIGVAATVRYFMQPKRPTVVDEPGSTAFLLPAASGVIPGGATTVTGHTSARHLTPRGTQTMSTPGAFVSTVQQALTNAGFDTQGADNDWGSRTSAAASAFQSAHGMAPTGLPEPELLRALGIAIPEYSGAADIASALASNLNGIVDPRDAIKVLLNESGMDPSIVNYSFNHEPVAAGIFQLLVSSIPEFTGMSLADWTALSAAQQVPFAAKFWRQEAANNGAPTPMSARDLYWLNYLPATYVPGAADDYEFVRSDDTYLPRGSSDWKYAKGFYTQNTGLDHSLTPGGPPKGFITAGDMGLAAARGAMNHPATYAAITDALSPQGVA